VRRFTDVTVLPPFSALIEAHGDELLAHARRLAGAERAEDVLQDALLRALRAYPRLRHADHLRAWLYRITTNAAMDAHRAQRREIPDPDPAATQATTDDPEAVDGFEDLIAGLPETARGALRLRFVDDLEYEVIALRLDCTPEAARQRVSSAVRTLRQRIAA
jgi:RNA polymerase sigma-70 factor (ECF subfamily)